MIYLGAGLTRLSLKKGHETDVVVVVSIIIPLIFMSHYIQKIQSYREICLQCEKGASTQYQHILSQQEGQHPLTGQRAPPISGGRDLQTTQDFNWWLLGKPVSDCVFAVFTRSASADRTARAANFRRDLEAM